MLTTRRRALAATALGAVVTLAGIWALLLGPADRLPDPIAVHWNGFTPDNGVALHLFALQLTGFYLIGAAITVGTAARLDLGRRAARRALGAGIGLWAGIGLGTVGAIVAANLDAADWQGAGLSGSGLALMIALMAGAPVAAAAVGFLLGGRGPDVPRDEPAAPPALDVPAGSRLAWSRRQDSPATFVYMSLGAAALVLVGLLANEDGVFIGVMAGLAVVAAIGLSLGNFAVTIGARGVQVRFGVFGWPRWHIALDDIESAVVEQRGMADVGGWGVRIVPGRWTAVMTRRGECLVLRRIGKRDAIISVDDAETAAAVVNTLLRRTTPRS